MPKFSDVVAETGTQCDLLAADLAKDLDGLTPAKRTDSDESVALGPYANVKLLKKSIKVEKD